MNQFKLLIIYIIQQFFSSKKIIILTISQLNQQYLDIQTLVYFKQMQVNLTKSQTSKQLVQKLLFNKVKFKRMNCISNYKQPFFIKTKYQDSIQFLLIKSNK
ncbi:hypothetical protein TTHERM_000701049 (macronuclear) [Tetrahymena thermophila SB210]|uniref:Uncharacterized protein n=1 Tax=Tetrahymena thermophila (strain SB210) TaxID=312017 RepID=W7XKP6_TETTS|nr:hypothetical protein TTHERM_000701049 [Tetrahymena thermophila SB210]EWS76701.1 hypothetical protein TTHERM_000701049 [Tetrahymena thermophila SB210]|eukprot:XP_012650771.1 hypothetical protein TTHERM_000701049 [Tetrahymena thermophila SB210]